MRRTLLALATMACAFAVPAAASAATINATPATFASVLSSAQSGDTILLASGSYGTWAGTNKAVTIKAADGATPTMKLNLGNGDSNFTLDGLQGMGGNIITSNPQYGNTSIHDITIKNSDFTSQLRIDGPSNSNIVLDHNVHHNINLNSTCSVDPAAVYLPYDDTSASGVTVKNSVFRDGNADGLQIGNASITVLNNEFVNLHEKSGSDCAHTDPMQFNPGVGSVIRGNWVHNVADGIVAYDGTGNLTIEDNVVDLVNGRWGIELYADNGSTVRHNTLVYRTTCEYSPCGHIILDHKSSDPAGRNTQVYDNLAYSVDLQNGSTAARNDHNPTSQGATYAGGASPSSWAGYALTGGPGKNAASDGLDAGIRVGDVPPPADTTPPDTTITEAPVDGTATSAIVAFTATEPSTFECKLDNDAYAACASPRNLAGLAVGDHTFSVRATDLAGNTDQTPATVTWTVQAPPPPGGCDQACEDAYKQQISDLTAQLDAMTAQRDQLQADLAAMTASRDAWKARAEAAEAKLAQIHDLSAP